MSDNIPFELQWEIMKRLPAESLIRFRSVCKSWKSLIHSYDFIAGYRGQQHLLVRYKDAVNHDDKYVSIVDDDDDDDTSLLQKVYVTDPQLVVNMLKRYTTVGSTHGLLCLFGKTDRAIIWNPSIRKAVAVSVSKMADNDIYRTVLGFGVCCKTNDPKIVKINYNIKDVAYIPWQVEVFTLSTGAWRSLSNSLPRKSVRFGWDQVVVDGCLYWLASVDDTFRSDCLIVSFDLTSEEFREVNLPSSLAHSCCNLSVDKLRESLVVVEGALEANKLVYHVWMMKDGVPRSFERLYTISNHLPGVSIVLVCGFRKTGEPLIELHTHPGSPNCILAAYDPYSKFISNVGIIGRHRSFSVYTYMETLLLL